MFKQSDKITIWKLLGLLFFYLIDYNAVLVSCCTSKPTKQKVCVCEYTNTLTRTLVMKMALEKGYIFPLKLKVNKMVSNVPWSHTLIFFRSVMYDYHKSDLIIFLYRGTGHPEF